MLTVTLFHATAGQVSLPWPAHEQEVEVVKNQIEQRAASGKLRTVRLGPVRYLITRVFEDLDDQEQEDLMAFIESIDFAAESIEYQYQPHGDDTGRVVPCKIVGDVRPVRIMRDVHTVTITFEQATNPNRHADPVLAAPTDLLGTPGAD